MLEETQLILDGNDERIEVINLTITVIADLKNLG